MEPVYVTASTVQEISLLVRLTGACREDSASSPEIYRGFIGKRTVLLAVTGIGKVNAASAATALLQRAAPQLLINTGCAGAYPGSGLAIGDLAVASSEVLADEGVLTPAGWQPMELIGIPLVVRGGKSFYNELPLSLQASGKAVKLASAFGLSMKRGKFLTVSTCSGTLSRGQELAGRYGGICENMEGGAIAQVALRYGVDCLEIRGVSNLVEDRDMTRWDIPRAVEAAQRFVLRYIEEL